MTNDEMDTQTGADEDPPEEHWCEAEECRRCPGCWLHDCKCACA